MTDLSAGLAANLSLTLLDEADVTDGVHAVGGSIFSQLWHIGAQREPGAGPYPDSICPCNKSADAFLC